MNERNPWLALSTYEEKDERRFFGRDTDTQDLFTMLLQNESVVCYAASGEGKSSLINAGLCPKLRRNEMFPIKIKFTSEEYNHEIDFDRIIDGKIKQSLLDYENIVDEETKELGIVRSGNFEFVPVDSGLPSNVNNYLWWKLRTHKIRNPFGGELLTPVIIFDQFEEIFKASWKAEFFKWLAVLSNDICPDIITEALDDKAESIPSTKLFKMLFSMRYEYIGELDYWCSQKNFIPQMMRNRFFLRPLDREKAISIIVSNAGNGNTEISKELNASAERIVDCIKRNTINKSGMEASSGSSDDISAIALSLVCYVLYDKLENGTGFTLDDNEELEEIINNSIYKYYDDQLTALKVPDEVRKTLEEVLSPNNDRPRIPVTDQRLRKIHIADYITDLKDEQGNVIPNLITTHILKRENIANNDYIEFIHDRLVLAIAEHKEEERLREEEQRIREKAAQEVAAAQQLAKKRKKTIFSILIALAAIAVLILKVIFVEHLVDKPIVYHYETIKPGDTIPIHSHFYSIPNGRLILRNCTVLPHTFANNKRIQCVIIDSVRICPHSIPYADTLIIGRTQLSYFAEPLHYPEGFFEQFKTIIVEKPVSFSNFKTSGNKILIPNIESIKPSFEDSVFFKQHRGTLFALQVIDSSQSERRIWHPLFTESTPIMVDDGFFGNDSVALKEINTILRYDLADTTSSIIYSQTGPTNIKLRLICSDPNKDTLHKGDIPYNIKNSIIEVNFSDIKVVEKGVFSYCSNLQAASFDKVQHIGKNAFNSCKKLKQLSLPSVRTIDTNAFQYDEALTELSLPQAVSVGYASFGDCYGIQSLYAPRLKHIGYCAFRKCTSLKEIQLDSVETIEGYAFSDDTLNRVILPLVDSIGAYAFNINNPNAEVICNSSYIGPHNDLLLEGTPKGDKRNDLKYIIERVKVLYFKLDARIAKDDSIINGSLPKPTNDPFYNNIEYTIIDEGTHHIIFKRSSDYEKDFWFYYFNGQTTLQRLEIGKITSFNYGSSFGRITPIIVDTLITHSELPSYHGDLIINPNGKPTIIARKNRETYVSAHPMFQQPMPHGSNCNSYIALYRTKEIDNFENSENITLYVPYGQLKFYQTYYENTFKKVVQLNVFETIKYRVFYGSPVLYIKFFNLLTSLKPSVIDLGDILSFVFYFIFSILLFLLLNRFKIRKYKKKIKKDGRFYFDIFISLITYAAGGLIIFFSKHENGDHFSMWPAWKYAIPLLALYIVIVLLSQQKKKNNKNHNKL